MTPCICTVCLTDHPCPHVLCMTGSTGIMLTVVGALVAGWESLSADWLGYLFTIGNNIGGSVLAAVADNGACSRGVLTSVRPQPSPNGSHPTSIRVAHTAPTTLPLSACTGTATSWSATKKFSDTHGIKGFGLTLYNALVRMRVGVWSDRCLSLLH